MFLLQQVDSLNYIPAANRYHFYRHASGHPRFREMREFELYYNLCLTQNTTYSVGDGTAFGFGGRALGSYTVRPRREQSSIIDKVRDGSLDRIEQFITLTDRRTFAFLANCWTGADQRSFDVYSLTPDLSPKTKRMIEDHAVSLGFNREEIVFLSYSNCGEDPLPDNHFGSTSSKMSAKYGDHLVDNKIAWNKPTFPNPVSLSSAASQIGSGKLITSRATINPIPGNTSMRRVKNSADDKLSLATVGVGGWSRQL